MILWQSLAALCFGALVVSHWSHMITMRRNKEIIGLLKIHLEAQQSLIQTSIQQSQRLLDDCLTFSRSIGDRGSQARGARQAVDACTMTEEEQQKAMDQVLADAHEDCPIFGPEDFH